MTFKGILLFAVVSSLLFSFTFSNSSSNQNSKKKPTDYVVGFYNVENLFDTLDDPHKNDNEFLPDSKKKWSTDRYAKKLNDIASVIYSIDSTNLPVVFGLAEVENKEVVQDLVKTEKLDGLYEVIHKESPDPRGIDVAVIYQPKKFQLISQEWIRFQLPDKEKPSTRDIVYVSGTVVKNDTIHFFFCHWPSRYGGTEKTIPFRAKAASTLRAKVDSLYKINANAKIIIMGDLNDHPEDPSVSETLKAKKENSDLINLMWQFKEKNEGTHFYKGDWGVLDHIIVSNSLLQKNKGLSTTLKATFIHKPDFVLYTNKEGVQSPSRTYGGTNYYGGYSDHLPVYLRLKK
ncbi:MAG: endonuclease/exonuclease/phosphatase family protein [Crocinitomicaceae bacterium]|nr:endonuclease/exonuclease/phosphatase family protein [Crocinitomicaceae bacterium]